MPTKTNPVRIGMMSFAHIRAEHYAECINGMLSAKLAGIADENEERGREMAAKFGTEFFADYADLLAGNIDAVIICSESLHHKDLAIAAADAGKHILVEMPFSTSREDGIAMLRHCKDRKVKLCAALPSRFSSAITEARQAIQQGKIGKILAMKGISRSSCPGDWFTDTSVSGGGAVIDRAVRTVDLMRWLIGKDVTEVHAEISNLLMHKGFDDTATLTLTFEDGVFATLDPSWSRPKSLPLLVDDAVDIVGSEGSVRIDVCAQRVDIYSGKTDKVSCESPGDDLDMALITSFVASITDGQPVEASGEDGLAGTAVALAAYESAQQGAPVSMTEP
jgi:predicted dehydrogenase